MMLIMMELPAGHFVSPLAPSLRVPYLARCPTRAVPSRPASCQALVDSDEATTRRH
jgi:hypothetical protein